MNRFKVLAPVAVVLFGLVSSCAHAPSGMTARQPGNESKVSAGHLSSETKEIIELLLREKNATKLTRYFNNLKDSQVFVSYFDESMSRTTSDTDGDKIYTSELYCKLMNVRRSHEHAEEAIIYAAERAYVLGTEYVQWFFQTAGQYAQRDLKDSAYPAAMGQLFRMLVDREEEICGSKSCIKTFESTISLPFNPLVNREFTAFIKTNRKNIAASADQLAAKPGSCFAKPDKRKPQQATFDWVNRDWVGSVLPKGHFVFTYDDGPHAQYTRVIRDTWANAGLPKPAFFWLRQNASNLKDIVSELNDQGYIIGSHSERHSDLGTLAKSNSAADLNSVDKQLFAQELAQLPAGDDGAYVNWRDKTLDREINQSIADLSIILGKPVRYYRLPYGSGIRNELIGARFEALNIDHFFWRIDSLDWQDKNPESIRDRVVSQMNSMQKGIILFHDIHPQSAQAAQLMVDYLKSNTDQKAVSIMELPGLKP